MLRISLFFRGGRLDPNPQYVGKHRRVAYHNGEIDLRGVLHDQREPQSTMDRESVLVTGRYGILQLAQMS
jgi:hypothetical protein